MQRIVLAYSGSAAADAAVRWLAEQHGAEVVALTLDVGQGGGLEEVRDRALAAGAIRAHVLDVREEFIAEYLLRALRAGVLYDRGASNATAVGRPLIAKRLVEIARIEQTTTVAHACGEGDSRIATAIQTLAPAMSVVAPPTLAAIDTPRRPRRIPAECPDEPAFVTIAVHRGKPSAINGIAMPSVDLIASLDIIAGAHGVGHLDRLETPGAAVLHSAHVNLGKVVLSADVLRFAESVAREYRDVIESGAWFAPLRRALDASIDAMQEPLSGVVRLKLFKGACDIVAATPDDGQREGDDYAVVRPLRFRA
jgi:argininosuccinate synthase